MSRSIVQIEICGRIAETRQRTEFDGCLLIDGTDVGCMQFLRLHYRGWFYESEFIGLGVRSRLGRRCTCDMHRNIKKIKKIINVAHHVVVNGMLVATTFLIDEILLLILLVNSMSFYYFVHVTYRLIMRIKLITRHNCHYRTSSTSLRLDSKKKKKKLPTPRMIPLVVPHLCGSIDLSCELQACAGRSSRVAACAWPMRARCSASASRASSCGSLGETKRQR